MLDGNNFPEKAYSDGSDIRFTDVSNTELNYWIESYDYSGKSARIWVKVPRIPAGSTVFRMYYANPSASAVSSVSGTFIREIDGVVGSWHFDEGSGTTAYDSSGMGNSGTLKNGLSYVDGKFGKALSFDGDDDYVEIRTTSVSASEGTVELWAKASGFSAAHHYFWGHTTTPVWTNRIQLYTNDEAGNLDLGLGDNHSRATNIQDLDVGVWYHIVLTWDGTNYVVYLDGISKASGTYTDLTSIHSFADIGNNGDAGTRNEALNGTIDEVRIYNKNLNVKEISDLYNNYGYTKTNYPGKVIVRSYTPSEPAISSFGQENPVITTGSIAVSSSPSGADIYLDGEYQGTTPKTISDVTSGDHKIELKKSGYENWSKSVNIETVKTTDVSATLLILTLTPTATLKPTPTPTLTPTPTATPKPTPTPTLPETGYIYISTNIEGATFTISGPATFSGSGTSWSKGDAPAGTYTITYGAVSGYDAPLSETKTLSTGGLITFTGRYEHQKEWWKRIEVIASIIIAISAIAGVILKLLRKKE
jgi:hypothetical protein